MSKKLKINGNFTYRPLARNSLWEEIPAGGFGISHRFCDAEVEAKNMRRSLTGKWFLLRSQHASIRRFVRFVPNAKGKVDDPDSPSELFIDWTAWLDLIGDSSDWQQEVHLEIRKLSKWMIPICILSHPDPLQRIVNRVAGLALALGMVSVILAILAL